MVDNVESAGTAPGGQGQAGLVDQGNIGTHFTIIAVINLVVSIPLLLVGALVFFGSLVGAGFVGTFADVPGLGPLIAAAGAVIGLLFVAAALPGVLSAIGLFQRRSWAKVWTIIVGALSLLNVPIGTLFGIYAIWIMTRPEADAALS